MAHCNQDHRVTLATIASHAYGEDPGAVWRMVGLDVDGCDLGLGEQVYRIAWAAPLADPDQVQNELLRLARAAR